jgi:hypothetical protein
METDFLLNLVVKIWGNIDGSGFVFVNTFPKKVKWSENNGYGTPMGSEEPHILTDE